MEPLYMRSRVACKCQTQILTRSSFVGGDAIHTALGVLLRFPPPTPAPYRSTGTTLPVNYPKVLSKSLGMKVAKNTKIISLIVLWTTKIMIHRLFDHSHEKQKEFSLGLYGNSSMTYMDLLT